MDELGKILRSRRIELGYSIEDVQKHLKFTKKAIIDLEENTKTNFNDPLFFNLYLKKYADLLELDFEALCDYYDVFERTQTIELDPSVIKSTKIAKKIKKSESAVKIKTPFYVEHFSKILIVVVLLILAYLSWNYLPGVFGSNLFGQKNNTNEISIPGEEPNTEDPNTEDPNTEDPNTEDPNTGGEEPEEPEEKEVTLTYSKLKSGEYVYKLENSESIELKLKFSGKSWIGFKNESNKQLVDGDGNTVSDFTKSSGSKTFTLDNKGFRINIGNHHYVKVYINGILLPYENRSQNDYKLLVEVK